MNSADQSRLTSWFGRWNRRFATAGTLALAALLLVAVSGIVLAVGYDVGAPRSSLSLLQLSSGAGRLLRALHAWSGNLLVILGLMHVVEHLAARGELKPRWGVWARAVLAIPLLLGAMLTGFVLKGDADAELARQIATGLLEKLPLLGEAAATSLFGTGADLQIPYLHHAATLTVALALVAVEHGRRIWPSAPATLSTLLLALGLGMVLPPALHDGVDPVRKGPWYSLAVQEALHHLTEPGWIWVVLVAPLVLLVALPKLESLRRPALNALVAGLVVYLLTGVFAALFRGAGWELRGLGRGGPASRSGEAVGRLAVTSLPEQAVQFGDGKVEGCVGCHSEVSGIESSHDPKAMGCFSCHLGNPDAPDAASAHAGLVRVPGNLDTAARSCGRAGCHGDLVGRVAGSPMATVRGMIAVDRWAFGERPAPDGSDSPKDLGDSAADRHLRQLCVNCHLGQLKDAPGPVTELSRGGGCAACHVRYPEGRDYSKENARRFTHPKLTVQVGDESCFGCHSRSGRISLAYAGWRESALTAQEAKSRPPGSWRLLEDGRVLLKEQEDVHHALGMACIDCHLGAEAMGDGSAPLHEEQATKIRCQTCHRVQPAKSVLVKDADKDARVVARLRGLDKSSVLLAEDRSGLALSNARPLPDGNVEIRGKLSGKVHLAKPPARACAGIAGHERLSCQSCHSSWTTQCLSCHTQWDASGKRFDALAREERAGAYAEYDAEPKAVAPALGVLERDGEGRIEPVAPGMILTLNGPEVPAPRTLPDRAGALMTEKTRMVRAFALSVPHTTTRAGRSCASCHSETAAAGLGVGTVVSTGGVARFEPESGPLRDGLPADAWIGAAENGGSAKATRTQLAPLDRAARERTLRVGGCLRCHDPGKADSARIYSDFPASLERRPASCR